MGDAIRKDDRRPTTAKAIPPRVRRLAAGDFDRDAWLDLGRQIASDQGRVAWEAAYWTLYGPERLGNWANQFLGDGTIDPAEDPDAIFPQSGATLNNYRVTARRFPPSIVFQAAPNAEPIQDADGDLVYPLRWPDVIWSFTIWQDLTPKDLPDDFVFRVLDAIQDSFDAAASWAPIMGTPRPGVLCRADVRRAIKAYRVARDDAAVADDSPVEDSDAGLARATQGVIPFPGRPDGNPFEDVAPAPRRVDVVFRRVIDFAVGDPSRPITLYPTGPLSIEATDDRRVRIMLDRDAVRTTVLDALDALPGADGLALADWIADRLEGGTP